MNTARLYRFRRPSDEQPASPPATDPKPARWGALSTPVHVADTEAKARAASLLAGINPRDGRFVYPSDLTPSQARDVCRWYQPMESDNV